MLWQIILLLGGILCLLFWRIYAAEAAILQSYGRLFAGVAAGAAAIFVLTELLIIRGMFAGKSGVYPYLIVLGAQVDGRRITDSLKRRLDRAEMYLKEHVETIVIVSGGRGDQEEIPEAEAMEKYLLEKGIEGKEAENERKTGTDTGKGA